jgi:hypothetical protein
MAAMNQAILKSLLCLMANCRNNMGQQNGTCCFDKDANYLMGIWMNYPFEKFGIRTA